MSPTARSLKYCREQGWPAAVVERWNPHSKRRIDLFGWCDIVALTEQGILGIQACAGASHAARATKAKPLVAPWIESCGIAEVWSWSQRGAKGKRKLWVLRREDLDPMAVADASA